MTNPAYEATNSDVANLINEAKQSSFVMEYISNFQPEDIDSDDIDLRYEADGVDTGCDVSIVDQCGKAATLIDALIAALEQAEALNKHFDLAIRKAEVSSEKLRERAEAAENRIAELEAGTLRLVPHLYRECVNELTTDAKKYANAGQLRERLSYILGKYIEAGHPHTRAASGTVEGSN